MTRIIRLPAVEAMTGLKRSSIYSEMQAGCFPLQIPIGLSAVGWVEEEVQAWVRARIAARHLPKYDAHKFTRKSELDLTGRLRTGMDTKC